MFTEWTDLLLLHLVRDPETIERLGGKLEPKDIAEYTLDANRGFMWKCSKDYYQNNGSCIPIHFLSTAICDRLASSEMQMEDLDGICALIDEIYAVPEGEFNADIATDYAKRILVVTRVSRPLSEMMDDGLPVAEMYEEFQRGVEASAVSVPTPIDAMANWEAQLNMAKPIPFGGLDTRYFNAAVNGGLCPGEIVILAGPSGGFKTSIAIDLVCAIAKNDEDYAAYFSYEQAFNGGDLPTRLMTRLSGLCRMDMQAESREEMGEEKAAIMDAAKKCSKRALIYDRSRSSDKVEDIANTVRTLINQGKKPRLVVIDQLLTWLQLWPEFSKGNDDWIRKTSTHIIKMLKALICEKYGVNVLVLHQITAAKNTGKKGQTFAQSDSAENKGIAFWADFMVTIGSKDEHNVFQLAGVKTRRGANTNIIVRAIPDACRFTVADDYTLNDRGVPENKHTKNVVLPAASINVAAMRGGASV